MSVLTLDRFWSKVAQEGDCWTWIGSKSTTGYGRFTIGYRQYQAHRLSYAAMVGEIPDGLQLDHLCRNRACVNPYHLDPVTQAENLRRGAGQQLEACPKGHPYTTKNSYIDPRGYRRCHTCRLLYVRARRAAIRARRSAA